MTICIRIKRFIFLLRCLNSITIIIYRCQRGEKGNWSFLNHPLTTAREENLRVWMAPVMLPEMKLRTLVSNRG